jgi:endonuclease/exonuclease/phosphatase family metal-dependent hydrolase
MDVYMKFSFLLTMLFTTEVWAWSLTTFNMRNFDNDRTAGRTNIAELVRVLQAVPSDVFAFEEVVNEKAFDDFAKKHMPHYEYKISTCGGFGKQKLAIVYNPKSFKFVSQTEDMSFSGGGSTSCGNLRPAFLVTLKHARSSKEYIFGLIHLKAGSASDAMAQRWRQYELLVKLARKYASKNLILAGDFNTTGYLDKSQDFTKFENALNLVRLRSCSEPRSAPFRF